MSIQDVKHRVVRSLISLLANSTFSSLALAPLVSVLQSASNRLLVQVPAWRYSLTLY